MVGVGPNGGGESGEGAMHRRGDGRQIEKGVEIGAFCRYVCEAEVFKDPAGALPGAPGGDRGGPFRARASAVLRVACRAESGSRPREI